MSNKAIGADNQQERLLMLSPDYIVGLVDGEGYFSVTARIDTSKTYRSLRVQMVFGIDLKEGDSAILHRVRNYFGCGTFSRKQDARPNFCNCIRYQVRDIAHIQEKIIPFFTKHILQIESKRTSFERFCEIADMFRRKLHLRDSGFKKIQILARQLHQ